MGYKYIKCHKCYGKGCSYCDYTGLLSRARGNKAKIDLYFNSLGDARAAHNKLKRGKVF